MDTPSSRAASAAHRRGPAFHGQPSPPPSRTTASPPSARRRWRCPTLFRPRSPAPAPVHASSASFRRAAVHGGPGASPLRHLTLSCGRVVELAPVPMGGNCGFAAVSWALLIAGRLPSNDTSGATVRRTLAQHVAAQTHFYARKLVEWQIIDGGPDDAARSIALFADKVVEDGIRGHWLGQMWGFLEILAVARAFRLNVELYTFDVPSQKVRMYHQQSEGKLTVAMLFSGEAVGGHFDLLLPTRRLSDLWKPRLKS